MKNFYLIIASVLVSSLSFSQTTSTKNCLTLTENSSSTGMSWTIPNNFEANVLLGSAGQLSKELTALNYSFTIPTTATITGIGVTASYTVASFTLPNAFKDTACILMKGGVAAGSDKRNSTGFYNSPAGSWNLGGSTDLWGTTWTPADINASNFGFMIRMSGAPGNSQIAFMQGFPISVFFVTASGIHESQTSTAKIYSYGKTLFFEKGNFQNTMVSIFDLSGKKVLESVLQSDVLDVSTLVKGVYFYSIPTDKGNIRNKFYID